MKQFFFLLTLAAFITACGGPEGQAVESAEAEAENNAEMVASAQYQVDPVASVINWEGSKIAYGHVGTAPVANGQLMVAGGKLVGGKFVIDLSKMVCTDLEGEKAEKLIGHLKSDDFFDTEKYPLANFTITKVQPVTDATDGTTHELTGNLDMKGQSRSITIPATVSMDGDTFKASTPKFTIDRTEWGVSYNNSNIVDIVKDDIINDNIGLEIMLVANK